MIILLYEYYRCWWAADGKIGGGSTCNLLSQNARFECVRGSSLLQIKIRIGHILWARNPRAQRCLARHAGRDRLEGKTDRMHENNYECYIVQYYSASSSSAGISGRPPSTKKQFNVYARIHGLITT